MRLRCVRHLHYLRLVALYTAILPGNWGDAGKTGFFLWPTQKVGIFQTHPVRRLAAKKNPGVFLWPPSISGFFFADHPVCPTHCGWAHIAFGWRWPTDFHALKLWGTHSLGVPRIPKEGAILNVRPAVCSPYRHEVLPYDKNRDSARMKNVYAKYVKT